MTDYAFFRGRLTGLMVADATDPNPGPEQGALATVVAEETDIPWVSGSPGPNTLSTVARIVFPSGAPCPLYAAYLHFFGTVTAPVTIPPTSLSAMPLVTVRRDPTDGSGVNGTQTIVINPVFTAVATSVYGSSAPAYAPNFVALSFWDNTNSSVTGMLGYFGQMGTTPIPTIDVIQPGTQVLVTTRVSTNTVFGTVPSGYADTWIVTPLNAGNTCICQITAGSGLGPYTASFYADGPANPATEMSVTVNVLQFNAADSIDAGTWLMAVRIAGAWYIQPAVFYT